MLIVKKKQTSRPKKRLQLDLTPTEHITLKQYAKKTSSASVAQFVKTSCALSMDIVDKLGQGATLHIKYPDGTVHDVVIWGISIPKQKDKP